MISQVVEEGSVHELNRADNDAIGRRRAVLEVIRSQQVGSQAQLGHLLAERGIRVTQATLSRDLKALGIGKMPSRGQGYVYVLSAGSPPADTSANRQTEIEPFVNSAKQFNNLVVIKTPPTSARHVARAIDDLAWEEVAGTIAGDDTVLVILDTVDAADKFCGKLQKLCGRSVA